MKQTVFNPQKSRLETIDVAFTEQNTTWFDKHRSIRSIRMLTDFAGGLLISEFDYTYPTLIYDLSREDIGYDQKKAKQLRSRYV